MRQGRDGGRWRRAALKDWSSAPGQHFQAPTDKLQQRTAFRTPRGDSHDGRWDGIPDRILRRGVMGAMVCRGPNEE